MIKDVPSSIDLRKMEDAREWADSAMSKRPWRADFFEEFARAIGIESAHRVLELGSGPGFLADHLLQCNPRLNYVALDFSAAMHELAVDRLGHHESNVQFVERSFRDPDWSEGLGIFEFVVTNQAVHELRHKDYASTLHTQVRNILSPNGVYLVCDHYAGEGGMANDQLYMTIEEQIDALRQAGFQNIELLLHKGGLVLLQVS